MGYHGTALKVLQVGIGNWGSSWATELLKHPGLVAPVGYVDVAPAMLQRLQTEARIESALCFENLDEALDRTAPDVVLVTTPLPYHASVAIQALERGFDVIVEKPMAPTIEDAMRMIEAADRAGRRLTVSQNYRHYPAARTVARLISDGALGAVGSATVAFRKYGNEAAPGESSHYTLFEPLLLDMSIHHFDLMRFVLGAEAQSVFAAAWNPAWSRFRDPAEATATVLFDDRAVVAYHGSWVSTGRPTTWAGEWVIECEDGEIEWTGRGDTTTTLDRVAVARRGRQRELLELPTVECFDRLGTIAEYSAAKREDRPASTDAHDNIRTLRLTLGAIASYQSGAPVLLRDTAAAHPLGQPETAETLRIG